MSELRKKIHEILKVPQLDSLATLTGDGKPWVCYVMIVTSENLIINFATFVKSRKVEQIKNNPEVHLTCGSTDPNEIKPYLQIQGRAQLNTSHDLRHDFWCGILEKIFQVPDDPNYGIIQVIPYRIEYCEYGEMELEVWSSPTA